MSNKSVSSFLLAASLFSGLVLTRVENREALAEPLRTSSPTQSQVRPGLNPAGSPQIQTQYGVGQQHLSHGRLDHPVSQTYYPLVIGAHLASSEPLTMIHLIRKLFSACTASSVA